MYSVHPSRIAEGKRRGGHTWRMRSSPAKGRAKTGQMAPPLAQPSPPGKEEQGRRESEKGKVQETEGGDELEALSGKGSRNRGRR